MKKVIFFAAILIVSSIFTSCSTGRCPMSFSKGLPKVIPSLADQEAYASLASGEALTTITVQYQGDDIHIKTRDAKLYSVGNYVEITRNYVGSKTNATSWKINPSPVLEKGQLYTSKKALESCDDCEDIKVDYKVVTYEYVKVKITRIQ